MNRESRDRHCAMVRAARCPSQIAPIIQSAFLPGWSDPGTGSEAERRHTEIDKCKPWPVLALPPSVLWNREFLAKDWPWRRTD